jgi:hypothetical protein
MSNRFIKSGGFFLTVMMLLMACQPAQTEIPSTPDPTSVPPDSQSSTSTPVATATTIPVSKFNPLEQDFKLYTDEPVVPMGAPGTWDSGLMDPGAVVFHENQFHMFYDALQYFPDEIAVGYAVSSDGIEWTRAVNDPVFILENVPWQPEPANFRANSVLVLDGTWVLYFSGSYSYDMVAGLVGRATASAPTGPWIVDPEPVLKPGETGEWDAGIIGHVDIILVEEGYIMYYSSDQGIGMATSTDGIHWTKYDDPTTLEAPFADSDPVIAIPAPYGQHDPNVVRTRNRWQMVYRSNRGLEYATSADGVHWSEALDKPLISSVDLQKTIWYSAFIIQNETAYLYFEAGGGKTSTYLATWTEAPLD